MLQKKVLDISTIEQNNKNSFIPFFSNNKFYYLKSDRFNNIIYENKRFMNKDYSIISTKDKLNSYKNNCLSDDRELLENNDNIHNLYKKVQEIANKMFEYYKNSKKIDEISKIILYYCSNY